MKFVASRGFIFFFSILFLIAMAAAADALYHTFPLLAIGLVCFVTFIVAMIFMAGITGALESIHRNKIDENLDYQGRQDENFDDTVEDGCPICGRSNSEIHDACSECGYNPYSEG